MKLMSSRKSAALHKRFRRAMAFAAFAALATDVYAASIKIESVAQRWPWNNKLDITYVVDGGQVGSAYARIEFTATIAGKVYTFSSGDIGASATDGKHTATWAIPSGLRATGCTVKADLIASDVPSGNDYMIVDLATGSITYEGLFVDQKDSNSRYNTDEYKKNKLVLRKVPAGGPYPTGTTDEKSGSQSCYPGENMCNSPAKWTTSCDYYMSIFELTQAQYSKICENTVFSASVGEKYPANGKGNKFVTYFSLRGDHTPPSSRIPSVTSDTGTFFQRLNFKTGLYFDLPTDVMWEIAARAGATTVYSWGEDEITENYESYAVLVSVKEVGTKSPNDWGFFDTTGNVDEICRDDNSQRDVAKAVDPFVAAWLGEWGNWTDGRYRMSRRGGATDSGTYEVEQRKTSFRHMIKPDAGYSVTGFRVSYVVE